MVQYYRDMWPSRSWILAPLIEASSGPKCKKIIWEGSLEDSFKELNHIVSAETLLNYPDWKIPSKLQTDASDKQLGAVISQNIIPSVFFSSRLSKPQRNYTTTRKKLFAIVECLKQLHGIIFGYEINVFSYHKNMVYAATLSEYQWVMYLWLIIKDFGPNIQHIYWFEKILSDTLSRFSYTSSNRYESCKRKHQCHANELFTLGRIEKNEYCFPLNISIVQREQQIEPIKYKLQTQYIHFVSRMRLLHASSRKCQDNMLW